MCDTWVIRVFLEQRLQDGPGLELIGETLVSGQGGDIEHKRIEDPRFIVRGILRRNAFHGLLERHGSSPMVSSFPIREECGEGRNVITFALALRAYALSFDHGRRG